MRPMHLWELVDIISSTSNGFPVVHDHNQCGLSSDMEPGPNRKWAEKRTAGKAGASAFGPTVVQALASSVTYAVATTLPPTRVSIHTFAHICVHT